MSKVKEFEIAKVREATEILRKIRYPIDYDAELSSSKTDTDLVSKKVVLISQAIKTTGDSSKAMLQIGSSVRTFQNIPPSESLTTGLSIGSLCLAVLNFLLIPSVYLTCYLLKTKIPATQENNAKWLISGILLALTITSIAVPAVAVTIAFIAASISLALSLFLLGRTIYECYQLSKERRAIRKLISDAEVEMDAIQKRAIGLKAALNHVRTESELNSLYKKITLLHIRFEEQKKHLLELKLKELELNNKLENANFTQVMVKGAAFSLSALGMIGLILSLYFPLVGLGILTAVSVVSLTIIAVRLAIPLVSWIRGKFQSSDSTAKEDHTDTYEHNKEPSTDMMLECFFGSKESARDILKKVPPQDIDFSLTSTTALFLTHNDSVEHQLIGEYQHVI
ncbi:coiled-coil protein [Legionella steigerwaltii]|uniref:Coiled-coil protein n=1 Tax=Legionella steigerwaltii TaxID=460 RepID=A0A378LET3_9GAMM|nr:hypothetical protein [Legionella steigerwaltii]KTD78178.1 coiled-coil protein [Legionella steigerwaltii]STY24372.1 coiled-coil protein [Legionella steigerwaltii]